MKKYILLAYDHEGSLNAMTKSEWSSLREETLNYVEELRRANYLISAEPLKSVESAVTVRVRQGSVSVTDGPFAETKETLGGIIMITARDLNEAIQVASRWPSARLSSVEVRPVDEGLQDAGRYAPLPETNGKH